MTNVPDSTLKVPHLTPVKLESVDPSESVAEQSDQEGRTVGRSPSGLRALGQELSRHMSLSKRGPEKLPGTCRESLLWAYP